MKITVVGTGYVGLVTGACFADLDHELTCVDIDEEKVKKLKKGEVPFYEPGLEELVEQNQEEGRIEFTTNSKEGVRKSDVIFICVGTPQNHNGSADLTYVMSAAEDIGNYIDDDKVVVVKSTVPVGANRKIKRKIEKNMDEDYNVSMVSNPEFLREGKAVQDFQNPDRVVIGVEDERAEKVMKKLYRFVEKDDKPVLVTNIPTAEMIKYASNVMLATRISFVNEISHLCEDVGADVNEVAKGMGLDERIGPHFLRAGAGYGGSCFPKDVKALSYTLEKHGHPSNLLRAVDYINERQKKSLVPKLQDFISDLEGKKIAVWGLSFKPGTSDTRNAPAKAVVKQLQDEYAEVVGFDPKAVEEFSEEFPDIEYADDKYEALQDADGLIICTEWSEFSGVDFDKMKSLMNKSVVIDGRNVYDPEEMEEEGFKYQGVGR